MPVAISLVVVARVGGDRQLRAGIDALDHPGRRSFCATVNWTVVGFMVVMTTMPGELEAVT